MERPGSAKITKNKHKQIFSGKVLIVDDVHINQLVAEEMLMPYGLIIETADNGFEAVEKIKNGESYVLILMDHMMSVMDGIKATKILRELGYTLPIAALTANSAIGQEEMFFANGFDAFIAKPIDSHKLDCLLKKFIKNIKPLKDDELLNNMADLSRKRKSFIWDAEHALKEFEILSGKITNFNDEDLELYTIAAHGIKSALAGIGEKELSDFAYKLELAGRDGNYDLIVKETSSFISALISLIGKIKLAEADKISEITNEDKVFLQGKLNDIKTACEGLNIKAAKTAVADLKQKNWTLQIKDLCNEISVGLLRGEFEKVLSDVEKTMDISKTLDTET